MNEPAKPPRKVKSGRSLSDRERRSNGQELVRAWLPRELVTWLDSEAAELGTSRTGYLERLLRAERG